MHNQEPIVLKTYDLLKVAIPILSAFPKNLKFGIADRLQTQLLDLLERILEALYAPREHKKDILNQVNLILEKSRFLVRLSFELRAISHGTYKDFSMRIDEIGRMTGGWLRSL